MSTALLVFTVLFITYILKEKCAAHTKLRAPFFFFKMRAESFIYFFQNVFMPFSLFLDVNLFIQSVLRRLLVGCQKYINRWSYICDVALRPAGSFKSNNNNRHQQQGAKKLWSARV